ncbi:hypothetical protein LTR37_018480 [Vermiconidia calcicola]|uniref:Uncharacterized protein n=1 Tax=Vermiconidia calcicola TaxID=1690605 RepID=A0ACC3MHX0_9PEZI|nr:hypothetical protein LTR37_018480 [Vermiconidia calcicola]
MISPELAEKITIHKGDATDSAAVEAAICKHECDAIVNTASNLVFSDMIKQPSGYIGDSVSSAAVRAGKKRGRPLRAWFIGGIGSLGYPHTGYKIHDYMPYWTTHHHRVTEATLKSISVNDLEWTLLCVGMMWPESDSRDVLPAPRHHSLAVGVQTPPGWQDHWIRDVPLNTVLEDVADLIAEHFGETSREHFVGELIGMKEEEKPKNG